MVLVSFYLSFLLCCNVLRLVSEKLEEKGGKRKCSRFFFFNFFKIDCFEVYERKMKIAAQLSFFPPRSKQQKGKSFLSYVSFVFAATKHVFPLNLFFFPLCIVDCFICTVFISALVLSISVRDSDVMRR